MDNYNIKKDKIRTGIKGFDKLVNGGFNLGSSILLSGTPGTGKTIFALEFIYKGAEQNEKGLYISLEDNAENLRKQAIQFGWNIKALEDKGLIKIKSILPCDISNNLAKELVATVKNNGIRRLVIDSISTLAINTPSVQSNVSEIGDHAVKRFIYSFISEIKKLKYTSSLLISQALDEKSLSCDRVSEFACDGIIHFTFESMGGEYSRSITVRKMRRENNDDDVHPLEIGKDGIIVHSIK